MLKVKAGKVDKLGLLFERYKQPLFGFFYRMTGGKADVSEDLVQNVFYRILKYRHTFKEDGKFKAWMYHLARNVYADQFKKKRPLNYANELAEVEGHAAEDALIETQMAQQSDLDLLQIAMNKLSEEKREVLILSRYQQLKYQEIAALTDSTEGAVKVRVHRALNDLRKIYLELEKKSDYES